MRNDGGSPSYGLCQVKLATARHMGFKGKPSDLLKPDINADLAAKYLRYQLNRYGSMEKALSAYNAGRYIKANAGYVAKVKKVERGMREDITCR